MKFSFSEENGISQITDYDLLVYSIGVSTGGAAEIKMVKSNPRRYVIATTIDKKGLLLAKDRIAQENFQNQIDIKYEDISKELHYENKHFDFIYARLVLHYLSKQQLPETLQELKRVLRPNGKIFIVVRSVKCDDANQKGKIYNTKTGMTTYPQVNPYTGQHFTQTRYFHTEKSISEYVDDAGFEVQYVKSYPEKLTLDFMRTQASDHYDEIIELLAIKKPNIKRGAFRS